MKGLITCLVLLLCLHGICAEKCTQATEGQSYFLKKSSLTLSGKKFVWKLDIRTGQKISVPTVVAECDFNTSPFMCSSPFDRGLYSNTLTQWINGYYSATLLIHKVVRPLHETALSWFDGEKKIGECEMDVYSPPTKTEADSAIRVSSNGTQLVWSYRMFHVYPPTGDCKYSLETPSMSQGWLFVSAPVQTDTNYTSYGQPVYHDVTCTLTVKVSSLPPGQYRFTYDRNTYSNLITLALPKVEIRNCSKGSDVNKPTASFTSDTQKIWPSLTGLSTPQTCLCVLTDKGHPQGKVEWLNSTNKPVGQDQGSGASLLTIHTDDPVLSPDFTCVGSSSLGKTSTVYNSLRAIPTKVKNFSVNSRTGSVELSKGEYANFVCDLEGNPSPSITITGQRSKVNLDVTVVRTWEDTFQAVHRKYMGCFDTDTYTCIGDNGVGDFTERNITVYVKCAVRLASISPTLFTYQEGEDLEVELLVTGYPEPTAYTLSRLHDVNYVGDYPNKDEGKGDDSDDDDDDDDDDEEEEEEDGASSSPVFTAAYTRSKLSEGKVLLTMSDVLQGSYVFTIFNGVGSAFDFKFRTLAIYQGPYNDFSSGTERGDREEVHGPSITTAAAVGICVAVGVILCVACFIIGIQVQKRRRGRREDDTKSDSHQGQRVPPSRDLETSMDINNSLDPGDLEHSNGQKSQAGDVIRSDSHPPRRQVKKFSKSTNQRSETGDVELGGSDVCTVRAGGDLAGKDGVMIQGNDDSPKLGSFPGKDSIDTTLKTVAEVDEGTPYEECYENIKDLSNDLLTRGIDTQGYLIPDDGWISRSESKTYKNL